MERSRREALAAAVPLLVAVLAVAAMLGAPHVFLWPVEFVHSDGQGYFAYLPAVFVHHSGCLGAWAAHGESLDAAGLAFVPAKGCYVDQFGIGIAVLEAPFYALGHVLAGPASDGYSRPEQFAAAIGVIAFLAAGLWLLALTLRRYFGPGTVAAVLLVLTFGTNLFHFGTYDGTFSHVPSFFLVAALLEVAHRYWDRPGVALALLLGVIAALIALVRIPNLIFVLVVPLLGVDSFAAARGRVLDLGRRLPEMLAASIAGAVTFAPQVVEWHISTGRWVIDPYSRGSFANLAHPYLLPALFGFFPHGAITWSPGLLLALVGVPLAWFFARRAALVVTVVLLLQLYLIASWWVWYFGAGFGHRGFIDGYPLAALAMGSTLASARAALAKAALWVVAVVAVFVTQVLMLNYWAGHLPGAGAPVDTYLHALGL